MAGMDIICLFLVMVIVLAYGDEIEDYFEKLIHDYNEASRHLNA